MKHLTLGNIIGGFLWLIPVAGIWYAGVFGGYPVIMGEIVAGIFVLALLTGSVDTYPPE